MKLTCPLSIKKDKILLFGCIESSFKRFLRSNIFLCIIIQFLLAAGSDVFSQSVYRAKNFTLDEQEEGGTYIARDWIILDPDFISDPSYQGGPKIVKISWYCSNISDGWYPTVTINYFGDVVFQGTPMPTNPACGNLYNSVYTLVAEMSLYPDKDWTVSVVTATDSQMTIRITFNGDYDYSSNGTNELIQEYIPPSLPFEAEINEALIFDVDYNPSQPSMSRTLDKTLPVAGIPGNFDVTPSGAATYSIPVVCPPGTGGMQPQISVVYNSMFGNGLLGLRWNLSGISSITRTGSTIYHDGETRGVELDEQDNYALDGQRLIIVSGSNGNYTFKTEINNFSVIKSYDSNSDGKIDYFKIWTKDGTTLEYGTTQNSVQTIGENYTWMLNKITNVHGNYMIYEYGQLLHAETFIKEIKYTGTDGMEPYNSIEFFYEERTKDAITTYKKGYAVNYTLLLYKIRTICENKTVNEYLFNYHAASDDNFTYLTEVNLLNSGGDKINSTIFNWNKNNITWDNNNEIASLNIPIPGVHNRDKRLYTGDFNGDGIADMVKLYVYDVDGSTYIQKYYGWDPYSENSEPEFQLSGPPQFLSDNLPLNSLFFLREYSEQNSGLLINDFDNDGADDIGFVKDFSGAGTNRIEINIPARTNPITITYDDFIPQCGISNFNGDGKNELFVFKEKTGSSNKEIYYYPDIFGSPEVITITQSTYNGQDNPIRNVMALDLNNDGRTDLIALCKYNLKIFYNRTGYDDVYHQKYFKSSPDYTNYDFTYQIDDAYSKVYPGDYDGNGLIDLLTYRPDHTWRLLRSRGGSFVTSILYNMTAFDDEDSDKDDERDYCFIIDLNKDGKSDIIQYDAHYGEQKVFDYIKKYTYISTGSGFTLKNTETIYDEESGYACLKAVGDFNGDAASDLVYYSEDNDKYYCNYSYNKYGANMISKIENGLGNELTIDYDRTSNPIGCYEHEYSDEVYPLLIARDPLIPFTYPLTLVSKVTYSDGIGGTDYDSYTYYGSVAHVSGKGFLGFNKVEKANASTGKYNITEFTFAVTDGTNTFYHTLPRSTESGDGSTKISESVTEYDVAGTTSDIDKKIIFPYAATITGSDVLKNFSIKTTNLVDNNGNITSSKLESFESGVLIAKEVSAYSNYQDRITISGDLNTTPNAPDTVTVSRENHRDDGGASNQYIRSTKYTYNTDGSINTTILDPGKAKAVTTTFGYYTSGSKKGLVKNTTVSSPGLPDKTLAYDYEAKGRFQTVETNPLGSVSSTFDPDNGNVLTETDIDGNTNEYIYNSYGELIQTKLPTAVSVNYSKTWYIGTLPNILYKSETSKTGYLYPEYTYYDNLGRAIRGETYNLSASKYVVTEKAYNHDGSLDKVSVPYYAGDTKVWYEYEYDPLGRLKEDWYKGTKFHGYTYSGATTRETNVLVTPNQYQETTYDVLGNARSSNVNGQTVNFTYYASGLPKESITNGTIVKTYYDEYGRQTKLDDKDAGIITYNYNAYGQLVSQTDARNINTQFVYDALGRITSETNPDGSTGYEYVTSGNGLGNLKKITAPNGTYNSFTYNQYGNIVSKTNFIETGKTFTNQYEYDQWGRITKITYPGGFAVEREYDVTGNLTEVSRADNGDIIWKAGHWNQQGQWLDYTMGNNLIKTEKVYDPDYSLTDITSRKLSTGAILQDFEYRFDFASGNLDFRKDHKNKVNGQPQTEYFQYDTKNRLTQWNTNNTGWNTISYNDDFEGNINTKDMVGEYKYEGSRPHAITALDNMPQDGQFTDQTITYNNIDRTDTISNGTWECIYTYGPGKNRRKAVYSSSGGAAKTIYYGSGYEENDGKKICYIMGGDGFVAIYFDDGITYGKIYYVLKDHLGSITSVVDNNGQTATWNGKAQEFNYDAWGRRRNPANWNEPVTVASSDLMLAKGFTAHEHLDEFELINMNGRVYDPMLGMFLSPDNYVQSPGNPINYNRYSYCMNNPLIYTDPSGEEFTFWHFMAGMAFGMASWSPIMKHAAGEINTLQAIGEYFVNGAAFIVGYGVGAAASQVLGMGGVLGGMFSGSAGGYAGGYVSGFGNSLLQGDNVFKAYNQGVQQGIVGGITGGIMGGIGGGLEAGLDPVFNRNIWTGRITGLKNPLPPLEFPAIPALDVEINSRLEIANHGNDPEFAIGSIRAIPNYYNNALAYEGVPYLGNSMSTTGTDCSGLVLQSAGIDDRVWRTAMGEPPIGYTRINVRTSSFSDFLADVQIGDVFLWQDGGHTAYYAGGVRLFHAHGATGTPTGFTSDLVRYYLPQLGYPGVFRMLFRF